MRRLAVTFSLLILVAGALSVTLVATSSGRTRVGAHPQTVARSPALAGLVPQAAVPPLALLGPGSKLRHLPPPGGLTIPKAKSLTIPKGYRPVLPLYGTCYVGVQQCSIHPCTVYVAPRTGAVVSSGVDQLFAPAPAAGPQRSTRCASTPVQKTVPVGNTIVTAVPAKTVLSERYVEPAAGR